MSYKEKHDRLERTESRLSFIGFKVETKKGSIVTVTDMDMALGENGAWNNKYIVECSICSDLDKYPHGSLKTTKARIKRGNIPCDCSKPEPSWKINIGRKFKTHKGNILTLRGVKPTKDSNVIYVLSCNICDKDQELFPEGSLYSAIHPIEKKNVVPCGCSGGYKWSKFQVEVMVTRKCEDRGYEFKGFAETFKGIKTYLRLYNPRTNRTWTTTTASHLLRDAGGDVEEGYVNSRESLRKDDEVILKIKESGNFKEGSSFWRTEVPNQNGLYKDWFMTCGVCSTDEFVDNGLCSGVFKTNRDSLLRGSNPCRCNSHFHWTKEQQEYRVKKVCDQEGITFLGWEDIEDLHCKSKVHIICPKGHKIKQRASRLIDTAHRCYKCAAEKRKALGWVNGYMPDRVEKPDHLYVMKFKDDYSKVGRALNIEQRLTSSTGIVKGSGYSRDLIEVIAVYKGTHQEVWDTEQYILDVTEKEGYYFDSGWNSETRTLAAIPRVLQLIENHSTLTKIEYIEGM